MTSLSTSALTGEQLYAPYGTTRYTVGSLGTAKAFTGQEADPLTGLYYYHARWYDPVVGVFLSVDTKEGNAQGVNPYGYVRENPETATDPTGERPCAGVNNCPPPLPPTDGGGCPGVGKNGASSANCTTKSTNPCDTVAPGMHMTSGGCVYNGGKCKDLSIAACNTRFGPPCYGNAECLRAMKSLQELWAQHDREANFVNAIIGLFGDILNIIGTVLLRGTILGMITAIFSVLGMLPQVLQVLKTGFLAFTGSVPAWVLALAPGIDAIGAVGDILNFFLGFIAIGLSPGEEAMKGVVNMIKGGISLMAGSILQGLYNGFSLEWLDQDDYYRYELDHTWGPTTIIAQCKSQGGAVC